MGSVVEIIARPSGSRTTPTSTPFAGPTATSFRLWPKCRAMTFSKKARLTLPIGYFRGIGSVNARKLLGVPWLKTSSNSLRRHDPDQVPRVYPSLGILSALLGSPRHEGPSCNEDLHRPWADGKQLQVAARRVATSVGNWATGTPASAKAFIFDSAVPLPAWMIAPACPIRLPGGALRPATYATTGFVTFR